MSRHKGLILTAIIWLIAVLAAMTGAHFRGLDINSIFPYFAAAISPAILTLILYPLSRREWAQLILIFAWLALAIAACVSVAFWPMVVLFLCAPAMAALFEKEKVVEAMFMAALLAGLLHVMGQNDVIPPSIADNEQSEWAQSTGVLATIAMMIAAMFGAAQSRQDLTDRQNELQPLNSELLDNAPGAVLSISQDNRVIYFSNGAEKLFGLTNDLGIIPAPALFPDDEFNRNSLLAMIERVRRSGKEEKANFVIRETVDELRYIDIRAMKQRNADVALFAHDSTSRRKEIEQLLSEQDEAEQDAEAKTLFFAGVSHELRTPLNAIIGFSDMMRSRLFGPLPNKYAEYADLIHDSGQHMLDLIGDVLDLTKVDIGKYELIYSNFDAADVIRSTIKMVQPMADAAEVRIDVIINVNQDLVVKADRKAIRQILLNLLSNAIKFTPKGGQISITASSAGNQLHMSVVDNGRGMTDTEIKQIGIPFVQGKSAQMTDARGSGLGLSLVKSLTDLHKGRFSIASQEGVGTTVDIYIPQEPSY